MRLGKSNRDIKRESYQKRKQRSFERELKKEKSKKSKDKRLITTVKKRFYNNEESLRKHNIELSLEKVTIKVDWTYVCFADGYLVLLASENKSFKVLYGRSRKSFNSLKDRLAEKIEPIEVIINGLGKTELVNSSFIEEVFDFLEVSEIMHVNPQKIEFEKLQRISPKTSCLFVTQDKSPYIKWLCQHHLNDRKIIPIIEIKKLYHRLVYEDGFLFIIEDPDFSNGLIVVWESVNEDRATYVFPVMNDRVDDLCQRIYNFAYSDVVHKRLLLSRDEEKMFELFGNQYKRIIHNGLPDWRTEIIGNENK